MSRELIGICAVAGLIALVAFSSRPASIAGQVPAKQALPAFTQNRGDTDADHIITVTPTGSSTAPWTEPIVLSERDGLLYSPDGSRYTVEQRAQLALWDQRFEIGGFAGGREDGFTAGVRISPVRLLYGCVAPDFVVANRWAGAGISLYAPETLVAPRWTRVGVGAWYGYPYVGTRDSAGWTIGVSISTR